jgi:UDPglucose 6-dehydrogenase
MTILKDRSDKIGIIGTGVVGGELYKYFVSLGYKVFAYDSDPKKDHQDSLTNADIIFICVPTLLDKDGAYDLKPMTDAFSKIRAERGEQYTIVVIKSTVIPGTTRIFQKEHSVWSVLFSPEFLTERYAERDTWEPQRQIVGCCTENEMHVKAAQKVLDILPQAWKLNTLIGTLEAAEACKLFANAFYALKVSYANQFYDYCLTNNIDYEEVRRLAAGDSMMTNTHLDVHQDNYRGFGGKCLPKDTAALLHASDDKMTLLSEAIKYNLNLMENL